MKTLTAVATVLFLASSAHADTPPRANDVPAIDINNTGAPTAREPNVMSTALRSADLDRSLRFYTQGLGMVVLGKLVLGPTTEVMLNFTGRKDQAGLVLFNKAGQPTAIDHGNAETRVILAVPDVASLAAKLKSAGYDTGDIHQNGPYKILMIQDPDGYRFELVERGAAAAPR